MGLGSPLTGLNTASPSGGKLASLRIGWDLQRIGSRARLQAA
jgi:hypothetical protein